MSEFRSQTIATLLRSSPQGKALRSSVLSVSFSSRIPVERRFKVANLFRFQRGRADLLFSAIIVSVNPHPGFPGCGSAALPLAWLRTKRIGIDPTWVAGHWPELKPTTKYNQAPPSTTKQHQAPRSEKLRRISWTASG